MRYLGYARKGTRDSVYVYVQEKQLVLDLRLSAERADEVRRSGLKVRPRNNYQGRAGWLTGVRVPHDTDRADLALQLILDALRGG